MYIMVIITIVGLSINVMGNGVYPTQKICEDRKNKFLVDAPKPKINYEVICVSSDQPLRHLESM